MRQESHTFFHPVLSTSLQKNTGYSKDSDSMLAGSKPNIERQSIWSMICEFAAVALPPQHVCLRHFPPHSRLTAHGISTLHR